jgi:Holliday junction resolvase RusA-like endonuclease
MHKAVTFMIPGSPVGKARPRFSHGHAYTPEKSAQYEKLVRALYRATANGVKWEKPFPVKVTILVAHQIPLSTSKKRRAEILSSGSRPILKPDADNVAKIILDALNGTAYDDDTQVVRLIVHKSYSDGSPHVLVTVEDDSEVL